MKIQSILLAYAGRKILVLITSVPLNDSHVFHLAVHLVGRSELEYRPRRMQSTRLQDIECSKGIDFKIFPGIGDACGNGHLCGLMDNELKWAVLLEYLFHATRVPDVFLVEKEIAPLILCKFFEIGFAPLARQIVDSNYRCTCFKKMFRHMISNKSRTSRN